MSHFNRRGFLRAGAAGAVLGSSPSLLPSALAGTDAGDLPNQAVHFLADGLMLTPLDYAQLRLDLAKAGKAKGDHCLSGGAVEELETRFAQALGKERAVFVPTGTLANHLAIRCQADGTSRALVQAESHIYNDSLDCVPTLSH